MKPGNLVSLSPTFISVSFLTRAGDATDMIWDGISKVKQGEMMVYLGEEISRFTIFARVLHSSSNRIGYIRADSIWEVRA